MLSLLLPLAISFFPPAGLDTALLDKRISAIEGGLPHAKLGLAIKDISSGQTWLYRGNERFPMQSTFKLPLGVIVLQAVERGKIDLEKKITLGQKDLSVPMSIINREVGKGTKTYTVRRLLELAVGSSDNTATDVLMKRVGGPRQVTSELSKLGVRGISIDRYERDMQSESSGLGQFKPEWAHGRAMTAASDALPRAAKEKALKLYLADPRDTSTPRGMMNFLDALQANRHLKPLSMSILNKIITETTTGPRRIKAGVPEGSVVAHKTGTAREAIGRAGAVNDVGIATLPSGKRLIIVVFLAGAGGNEARRDYAIAEVARAAVAAHR